MTLKEQIGQVLMAGFSGSTPSREIIDLISRRRVGNIILFSRNIRDARQVLELTRSLQRIAQEAGHRYPLLIAIDQENGIVQRLGETITLFPGNMALGAIASEEGAYKVALATGCELKALGINMNLAPVVDVNNNPANPVIGVRSFGEDPQLVARLGAAMVKGYHDAGIFSCLKHFPGHGDTTVDSHLALPTIPHTLERLQSLELVPFRSGIAAPIHAANDAAASSFAQAAWQEATGTESVMLAHVSFPALTEQPMLPATLSSAIVEGLLREQLGFNGIILSDCMEMRAISETFGTERAAVMALQAGVDLVLVSHHYTQQQGSIEAIEAAVQAGELSRRTIQQAAERVLRYKASRLSWNDVSPTSTTVPECVRCEAHRQLQEQAYELSATLVRNEDALLPLRLDSEERIVVLSLPKKSATMVEDRSYPVNVLVDLIEQYSTSVSTLSLAPDTGEDACEKLLSSTRASDIFIVATVNAHRDERQAELVRCLVSSGRRVIGMAVRNPYDLLAFPQLRTYLVTYEYTRPALLAAVRVLFGEKQARGHLPVSISQ